MKNKLLKSLALPMATIVLGVTGAFVTTSAGSAKPVVDQQGHYYLDEENPCFASIMCQTVDNGQICKSGAITLYGKTSATSCQVPLWKRP